MVYRNSFCGVQFNYRSAGKQAVTGILVLAIFIIINGCARQRSYPVPISNDLLQQDQVVESPFSGPVKINVPVNRNVKSHFNIESAMNDALKNAIAYSNLFGADPAATYELVADIQSLKLTHVAGGFGNVTAIIETHYTLFDDKKALIFETSITSEKDNHRYHFEGFKRMTRAHSRSVADNANQFVIQLMEKFGEKIIPDEAQSVSSTNNTSNPPINNEQDDDLAGNLEKLSELHAAGHLSDEEFQQAKAKLLTEQ